MRKENAKFSQNLLQLDLNLQLSLIEKCKQDMFVEQLMIKTIIRNNLFKFPNKSNLFLISTFLAQREEPNL